MTVEIPTYVPPPAPKEKPPRKVGEREAKKILQKLIDEVRQADDWITSRYLIRITEAPMGELSHGCIVEKEKLQRAALEVMKKNGLVENDSRGEAREDSDPIDHKVVRGYETEWRVFPDRTKSLFLERTVRTEGGKKRWVTWSVSKSSAYFPESMPSGRRV